jgi:fructosamine-3-kinase
VRGAEPVAGGCIHRCFRVEADGARLFVKTNEAPHADNFAAEADGLVALRDAGLRAPRPMAHGIAGGEAFLALEFLELRAGGDFAALGRMLASAHGAPWPRFGWRRDNYIGTTPQRNGEHEDWTSFWTERRLRPQAALARRHGLIFDVERVGRLLEGHHPRPALLHGDLWSGNVGFDATGPVVFDPAVYCGDGEADLAMTELFGGFEPSFYSAYRELLPLEPGYERRRLVYNLYHLLNHLNLFGSGYLGQVQSTLRLLLR